MSQSPEGWYPQADGRQRYWDGQQWTDQFAAGSAGQPPTEHVKPKRAWYTKKRVIIPAALIAVFVVIGALNNGGDTTNDATPVAVEKSEPAAPAAAKKSAAPKASSKPAPAKPAAPKIGTTVRDGKFAFTVRSVKCGIAKVGTNPYLQEKAQGQFCAVAMTVKNIGDEPQSMFADNQYAFDDKGRKFSANSAASLADEASQVLWEEINPGNSVKGTVYFDMPKGAKLAKLELHDSMFSGGVSVATK